MYTQILDDLSQFVAGTRYEDLPPAVVEETVRIILDSIGCGIAGTSHRRGMIGVEYGRMQAGDEATILGTGDRVSIFGAAFANAELINALDHDAVLPPGHVVPYVLPGAMAIAERDRASGRELILAVALAHEISNRIGKAMDYHRDIIDGKVTPPPVWGFASTIFGATAAVSKLQGQSAEVVGNALSLAGIVSPVNSAAAWRQHSPPTSVKYLLGGYLAHGAITAAHMAGFGHRGDKQIFEPEYGYPRFIGTRRWEAAVITEGLGKEWRFPKESSMKPYPHCRILHGPLDALGEIIQKNRIKPSEIEGIKAWVEGFVERPLWLSRDITDVTDAQFSIYHGLALGAHGFTPGPDWQSAENVYDPSVMALMEKVEHVVHPDYEKALTADGSARPTRVEVRARGEVFVAERSHPKGSGAPGSATYMTTPELVGKFADNSDGIITRGRASELSELILNLPEIDDVSRVMKLTGKPT